MNKKSIIGAIIAAAVIIGVVSMISYGNTLLNIPIDQVNTTQTSTNTTTHINTTQPIKTPGKHLSVELSEDMGVKASP